MTLVAPDRLRFWRVSSIGSAPQVRPLNAFSEAFKKPVLLPRSLPRPGPATGANLAAAAAAARLHCDMANRPLALDSYRLLGDSGLRVSPLCLGTMTFGTDWGWGADEKTSRALFDQYVHAGGNFIDTANLYTNGTSEKYLGDFLKNDRDRIVLATKYSLSPFDNFSHMLGMAKATQKPDPNAGGNGRKNLHRAVELSLKQLKTDYIDLYWVHAWDYSTPIDELMRGLDDLVRAGKVIYLGISDTPAWKVAQLNQFASDHALTRFVAYQAEYSLVQREAERDILPMCGELGIGVLPWSPLGGGVLTGKYTRDDLRKQAESKHGMASGGEGSRGATLSDRKLDIADAVKKIASQVNRSPSQVALRWLLTRDSVPSVILGARTSQQLGDNLGSLDFELDAEQLKTLSDASKIDLGFPHEFIKGPMMQHNFASGSKAELTTPYL